MEVESYREELENEFAGVEKSDGYNASSYTHDCCKASPPSHPLWVKDQLLVWGDLSASACTVRSSTNLVRRIRIQMRGG